MLLIIRKEEKDQRAVEEKARDAFWNVFHPSVYLLLHR